jgi:hypothetical protein
MSMEPWEAEQEAALDGLYKQFGPEWVEENWHDLYDQAVEEFTADRLRSYYLAHPNIAKPALDSLVEGQSLLQAHPKAALVFATTSIELSIKTVLLKPIVFGLVHTEAVAELVTDLTIEHTGMDRFKMLLTEILRRFGGLDLNSFRRRYSHKTIWQEIKEVQINRNVVIHRGELDDMTSAELSIGVASAILHELLPQVICELGLHLHDPLVVCGQLHSTILPVTFTIPGHLLRTTLAQVELNVPEFDPNKPPESIAGRATTPIDERDLAAMRSAPSEAYMQIVSSLLKYQVSFEPGSKQFAGHKFA